MIHSTATVPVNPEDERPLTRAQGYQAALLSTLKRTRELLAEGRL